MIKQIMEWLKVFRAQTAVADWLLVMVPFLHGTINQDWQNVIILTVIMFLAHCFSFGQNSLMDTAMGYDTKDPNKQHHPLVNGTISMKSAHFVIHYGMAIICTIALIYTALVSPAPLIACMCFFVWIVWGHAYNNGLSKETLSSFVPIAVCFAGMGLWGWFLSHDSLGELGLLYAILVMFIIIYQCAWCGHLKDLETHENSNLLWKLGFKMVSKDSVNFGTLVSEDTPVYTPSPKENQYLITAKRRSFRNLQRYVLIPSKEGASLSIIFKLLHFSTALYIVSLGNFDLFSTLWVLFFGSIMLYFTYQLSKERDWIRNKELKNMSLEEIGSIMLPLGIFLDPFVAITLMFIAVLYFRNVNKMLWKYGYPKV